MSGKSGNLGRVSLQERLPEIQKKVRQLNEYLGENRFLLWVDRNKKRVSLDQNTKREGETQILVKWTTASNMAAYLDAFFAGIRLVESEHPWPGSHSYRKSVVTHLPDGVVGLGALGFGVRLGGRILQVSFPTRMRAEEHLNRILREKRESKS